MLIDDEKTDHHPFLPPPHCGHHYQSGPLKAGLKPLLKELQARFDDPAQADRVLQVQVWLCDRFGNTFL